MYMTFNDLLTQKRACSHSVCYRVDWTLFHVSNFGPQPQRQQWNTMLYCGLHLHNSSFSLPIPGWSLHRRWGFLIFRLFSWLLFSVTYSLSILFISLLFSEIIVSSEKSIKEAIRKKFALFTKDIVDCMLSCWFVCHYVGL